MAVPARSISRVVFWIVFLAGAAVAARLIWVKLDPLRNHPTISGWWLERNYARLASPDREVAAAAWMELERCYLSKWAAYDWVVWRVKHNIWQPHDPPVHFGLRRSGNRYYAAPKENPSECRTVTDALMAILYQEPVWRTPHRGDWRAWWDANWSSFPNRERQALPSGPEDPRGPLRR